MSLMLLFFILFILLILSNSFPAMPDNLIFVTCS
jgi:hypothetical protein